MAVALFTFGAVFVIFGLLGWVGLATAPKTVARGAIAWPDAIQEVPMFLSIGFGGALIAAGAIVDRLDRMLSVLENVNQTAAIGNPKPGFVNASAALDARDLSAAEREQMALAARGWTIELGKNGRWRATGNAGTVNFESEREKRDWIEAELAQS